jgi:hypothetical protein
VGHYAYRLNLGSGPPLPYGSPKTRPRVAQMPDLRALGVSLSALGSSVVAARELLRVQRWCNPAAPGGIWRHKIEKDPAEAGRKKANIGG